MATFTKSLEKAIAKAFQVATEKKTSICYTGTFVVSFS